MCEILSLSGSFGVNENGIVTVSLANNEGRVIGGRVVGEMMAATLVTVSI
jgi:predicted DNA-binding protein with PD1-like motif